MGRPDPGAVVRNLLSVGQLVGPYTGVGFGKLYRLCHYRRENKFELKGRIYCLRHLPKSAQLFD
jgi:hypothetical protein